MYMPPRPTWPVCEGSPEGTAMGTATAGLAVLLVAKLQCQWLGWQVPSQILCQGSAVLAGLPLRPDVADPQTTEPEQARQQVQLLGALQDRLEL